MSNDDTNGDAPSSESAQIAAAETRADRAEPSSGDGASAGENSESSSSPWGVTAIALVGVAALVIAVFAVREGIEAWRGETCAQPVSALTGESAGNDSCC